MFTFYGLPIALNSQVLNIIMDYYGFVIHKFTATCVDNGIFDEMYSDHTSSGICLLFTIMYGRKGVVDAYFQIRLLDYFTSWWLELGDMPVLNRYEGILFVLVSIWS